MLNRQLRLGILERHRLHPTAQEGDHLLVSLEIVAHINKMLGQFFVVVPQQVYKDVYVGQIVEHHRAVLCELVQMVAEELGVFGPVQVRVHMVTDVVAIIPAFVVEVGIDASYTVLIRVLWLVSGDKSVLHPVASHGHQPEYDEWQDKNDKRCLPVVETQTNTQGEEQHFPDNHPTEQAHALLFVEIGAQGGNSREQENEIIMQEMPAIVPLIGHGGAGIVLQIAFGVVHANMMAVVRHGALPEEGRQNPRQVEVHPWVLEERPVIGAMEHKAKGAFERYIIEVEIHQRDPCP